MAFMQPTLHCLPFLGLILLCVSSTAQELSGSLSSQEVSDTVEIQQVINLYSIATDQKRFDLLPQIFTTDVTINFNTPGVPVLHGLTEVADFMSAALRDVVSFHAASTHSIDLSVTIKPHSTTYSSAKFFGVGRHQGQIISKWGRLVEESWRRNSPEDQSLSNLGTRTT